jgi:hypothetical protein
VGPTFFSDRSMYISKDQAKQLQKALQKIKVLDKNGWVRYDTRVVSGGWAGRVGGWGGGGVGRGVGAAWQKRSAATVFGMGPACQPCPAAASCS